MSSELGRVYDDGEIIVREGEPGTTMYVIQEGEAEVVVSRDGEEVRLTLCGAGDFIGEMAIFGGEPHSATVRAVGRVRALSVDKRNFLRSVHNDPSLAYNIVKKMSGRVRALSAQVAALSRDRP